MLKYCGMALIALITVLILREQKSEIASFVGLTAAVVLFGAAASEFLPAFSLLSEQLRGSAFERHVSVLTKALGVTLAVQFTAELCRDAKEDGIAAKLELVGKAELLLLAVPLMQELTALAGEILAGG